YEAEFRMLGADFSRRGARLEEYVRLLRALWTEESVQFEGEFFSLDGAVFFPKPQQRPHPPIYIGGSAARSAPRAARIGDGWMPMSSTPETFIAGLEALKRALAERGRSPEG